MAAPLTSELRSDEPRTAGPYRLLEQLGSDRLGQVFLGRSESGDDVAVTIIRAELAADPGFGSEVTAARTVSGAVVASVVDADLDGDVPWLATALVRGLPLADIVREHGPLSGRPLLLLATGLAEGLGALHAAGVVHGNLNPAHVLLAEDGPRVTGLGIWTAAASSGLPDAGFDSPGFLSPEQVLGHETGPASDIFSLGAVLVFACSGHGPFGSGTSAALMYRLVNSPADTASLPDELRRLVAGCLAKQPDERPAASRLLAELGALQDAPGELAGPGASKAPAMPGAPGAEPWAGSRRSPRRRRSWLPTQPWIAGGLLTAAAAIIVILAGAPSSPAGQPPSQAGAGLPGPASTSQAPINTSSSPSVPSGSSPAGQSPSGHSGGITPAVLQGPSSSSFLSPSAPPAPLNSPASGPASGSVPPSPSASPSPSSSPSPSASPSPSSSPSPSASPSTSSSPSPSSSPSSASSPASSPSQTPSATSSPSVSASASTSSSSG